MPEFDHTNNSDNPNWERIARENSVAVIKTEQRKIEQTLNSITDALLKGETVTSKDLFRLRSNLETIEARVTKNLEGLGEIDPDSEAESLHRAGRSVIQAHLELATAIASEKRQYETELTQVLVALNDAEQTISYLQ